MDRVFVVLTLATVVAIGMILLAWLINTNAEVYNLFAKSPTQNPAEKIERRWAFEGIVWTAVFSLSIMAVLIYLVDLREKY